MVDKENFNYKRIRTKSIRIQAILVDQTKVEGDLHLAPDHRLIDLLNHQTRGNPFLAVTDAKILFHWGERAHYKFFSLNRNMIICCFPKEETELEFDLFSDTEN